MRFALLLLCQAWLPLSQFRPRQQLIWSQNKAISGKDYCLTTLSVRLWVVVVGFVVNGNQDLLSYSLVNKTVFKCNPLVVIILRTEYW